VTDDRPDDRDRQIAELQADLQPFARAHRVQSRRLLTAEQVLADREAERRRPAAAATWPLALRVRRALRSLSGWLRSR